MSPPEVEYQHRSVSERIRSKESVKSFAPNVTAENLNAIIRNDDQISWKVLVPKKLIVMSFQEQGNPNNHCIHKLAVFNVSCRPATSPPTSCEKETHQPAPSPAPTNSAPMSISMLRRGLQRVGPKGEGVVVFEEQGRNIGGAQQKRTDDKEKEMPRKFSFNGGAPEETRHLQRTSTRRKIRRTRSRRVSESTIGDNSEKASYMTSSITTSETVFEPS
ncbi:unnamed protein product [Caenorhabditis nigoni]